MTRIDQFESVFKSAERTPFVYARPSVGKVMLVTDLDIPAAEGFAERVRSFLKVLSDDQPSWEVLHDAEAATVGGLLERVESSAPDLIVTYRNLHSGAWRWPHSLGTHLDVLTQATPIPVLVLPRPEREKWSGIDTNSVLALTDHLTGDARLVNWAARFTVAEGELCLAHIEDERAFERFLAVIAKISEIDTDLARREIERRLLKEPADYIVSVKEVLRAEGLPIRLSKVVEMGRVLADLEHLIAERRLDLLVLNTKDEDQLAMHGLAYPLAVELRSTPLLML